MKRSGMSHLLPPVQRLIASWNDPLAKLIDKHHRDYMNPKDKKDQPMRLYAPIVEDLGGNRIAGVALTSAISRLMQPPRMRRGMHSGWPQGCAWKSLASHVGETLYAEWQTTLLEKMPWVDKNGDDTDRDMMWLLRRRWSSLDASKIRQWFRRNSNNPIEFDEQLLFVQFGSDVLHMLTWAALFDDNKKAIQYVNINVGKRPLRWVFLDPKVVEAIDGAMAKIAVSKPVALPCVVEPLHHGAKRRGGYPYNKQKIVYRMSSRQRLLIEASEGAEFWDGINHIQSTSLSICKRTKEVQEQCMEEGGDAMGIPRMDELSELPRLPDDIAQDRDRLIAWIRAKRKIHDENIHIRGPRRQMSSLMQAATMMESYDKFWIPVRLDFRGRLYAGTPSLSYSSSDVHRGLLLMGEHKEPGPRGEWWKLVHAANCYGMDKLPFAEREQWARDHIPNMVRAATLGLDDDWWQKAKKPWQFFTACVSFVDKSVASRIMAGIDGSCSGLQHYAAMGLDEEAGRMVNLVPSDSPNDAYRTVLQRVIPIVQADAAAGKTIETKYGKIRGVDEIGSVHRESSGKSVEVAKLVLPILLGKGGRDIVKQPTMTFTYGVTLHGVRSQIKWRLVEMGISREDAGPCTVYLGDVIMKALKQSTGKASEIMDWFWDCADKTVRRRMGENRSEATTQTMEWTSPSGFPAVQPYWKSSAVKVATLAGKMNIHVANEKGCVLAKDSTNGIAPNVVHSFDAALLHRTGAQCGVGRVALVPVHDDFNSHLATMDQLNSIVRESFVSIYREPVLERLHEQFQRLTDQTLPPPPSRGNLDLDGVLHSDYFCH